MVQTPTQARGSFSVALVITLPLTLVGFDKSVTEPASAQAQERQCAVTPRCPPGATLQCDRGPCTQGGRAVIACVRYTCVGGSGSGSPPGSPGSGSPPGSGSLPALPLPKIPKERAAAVSCAARP